MRKFFTFLSLAILSISVNCAYFKPKPDLSNSNISINTICQRVENNFKNLYTLRGRGKLISNSQEMSFTASANISLKMPDRLLLKLSSGFGMTVASLLIDKSTFTLFNSTENLVYYGDLDSVNMNQYFSLKLDFSNLTNLLSGMTTLRRSDRSSLLIDDNKYLIHVVEDQLQFKYWVDPEKFVVTDHHIFDSSGEKLAEYSFKYFKKVNKVHVPTLIKVTDFTARQQLTLLYEDFEINKTLSDSDFFIKLPENVKIKYLKSI